MFAEGGDEVGGERDGSVITQQEREAFVEFDDKTGLVPAWEINLDETDIEKA